MYKYMVYIIYILYFSNSCVYLLHYCVYYTYTACKTHLLNIFEKIQNLQKISLSFLRYPIFICIYLFNCFVFS